MKHFVGISLFLFALPMVAAEVPMSYMRFTTPFHTFSTNVDDEKNLASLREISNFAHNNLLNILKL